MRPSLIAALAVLALWLSASSAGAASVAYWRMEADLDPSVNGLEVANELAFGTSLLSSEAFVDLAANPTGTVPNTGSINLGSIGSSMQGGANGINATAAWYPELDVASITLEFWARTAESTATLFRRTSGGFDGMIVTSPNNLTITYHVDDGAGGSQRQTLATGHDMDATWHHYAFTYDAATGELGFYVDAALTASQTTAPGRSLVWAAGTPVQLGVQMDFASAFNGTLDEVRIVDTVIPPATFLAVPEVGSSWLLAASLALGSGRRRQRGSRLSDR